MALWVATAIKATRATKIALGYRIERRAGIVIRRGAVHASIHLNRRALAIAGLACIGSQSGACLAIAGLCGDDGLGDDTALYGAVVAAKDADFAIAMGLYATTFAARLRGAINGGATVVPLYLIAGIGHCHYPLGKVRASQGRKPPRFTIAHAVGSSWALAITGLAVVCGEGWAWCTAARWTCRDGLGDAATSLITLGVGVVAIGDAISGGGYGANRAIMPVRG